jgi:hypothetical protein
MGRVVLVAVRSVYAVLSELLDLLRLAAAIR